MSRIRRFTPSAVGTLEERLVLSRAHHGVSVLVSTLTPRQYTLNAHQQTVAAQINQAFSQFQSDYGQARATYFASILNQPPTTPTAGTPATNAFMQYTTQRVALLGQQLTGAFLQYARGTAHAKGQDSMLKSLVNMYITGAGNTKGVSLAASLKASMPQVGASAPTESLFSLSQDLAIETARATMYNGLGILQNQYFGNNIVDQSAHS